MSWHAHRPPGSKIRARHSLNLLQEAGCRQFSSESRSARRSADELPVLKEAAQHKVRPTKAGGASGVPAQRALALATNSMPEVLSLF